MSDTEPPADGAEVDQAKITRDHDFKWIFSVLFWMTGLFWLMAEADFPDSFGLRLPHGGAGTFELYWYSYLLLQRHGAWDIALFVWLWGSALGVFLFLRHRVKTDGDKGDEEASKDTPS